MKLIIEFEPEGTLLQEEVKNENSAFGNGIKTAVIPAFRTLYGVAKPLAVHIEREDGTTIALPWALREKTHA